MEFEKRLERAIERGHQTRDAHGREQAEKRITEEELKNLHSKDRLELSEHIENCLRQLADHFPGYHYQSILDNEGWGAKVTRDDIGLSQHGQRENYYSLLQLVIGPLTASHIFELAAKGTIRNKELFNRTHYQFLSQVDVESFRELIDLWVLEFVEQYSARS